MVTPDYAKGVQKTAEQQMRQWALGLEIHERVESKKAADALAKQIHPYLAVSREVGTAGSEIARRVGQRLGWQVLDHELLKYMADKYHISEGMLEVWDESTTNWILEVFSKWLNRQVVTQSEYVTHLGEVVLMGARHDTTVFVGRGAQFFLPRDKGLNVQIVAPRKQRIQWIIEHQGLDRQKAEDYLDKTDQARHEYIQRYFHHDARDPHLYDLVINMQFLQAEDVVDLIVDQCRRRFLLPEETPRVSLT